MAERKSAVEKKKAEACEIIEAFDIPLPPKGGRVREKVALAFLAVAGLKPRSQWASARSVTTKPLWAPKTREIIQFWNDHYGESVSRGSYDDVRRRSLVNLVQAGVVLRSAGNPGASTNDPNRGYALSEEAAKVVRSYGTAAWKKNVSSFIEKHGSYRERYERTRKIDKIPASLPDGTELELHRSEHNVLQKAIVEEFLPRFAKGAAVLYLGDTSNKSLHVDRDALKRLNFPEISHDLLPDVVAFDPDHGWIFLIEAVHSSNPISQARHIALEDLVSECTAPAVYVSVFQSRAELKKWLEQISWETEVWLVDAPDHLIHFNGDRFLGPHT